MSLKRLLYTLFLYVIFPLVLLRLLWRSRANFEYRKRLSERLGFVPKYIQITKNEKPFLWLHAVSVGEAIAAKPLIESLLLKFPEHCLLLTTTTPTGSDRVRAMFANEIKHQQVIHVYFPYDLLGAISRFIKVYKPKILIVVETEIWPNLYAKCHQELIPIMIVNARLSTRSVNSYSKIKGLIAETLSKVSLVAVRSKIDADHFLKLGAQSNKIEEIGNIKYDISIDEVQIHNAKKYRESLHTNKKNKRIVFVAASTHRGEDAKILFIYKSLLKQFPELLLVLVPRHPERFNEVYEECLEQLPKELKVLRHSELHDYKNIKQSSVILGDSMGEMQMWYSLSDIVFIGGSLVKTGGHNPLEATLFGVPVFSGPHMFNFEDITSELSAKELLLYCKDEFEIVKKLTEFLNLKNIENQADQGKSKPDRFKWKADKFMQQHRGVTARLVDRISRSLSI